MAEYIDIDKAIVVTDTRGRERETTVRHILDFNKGVYETADVAPRCPHYIRNTHDRGDDSLCEKWGCEVKEVQPVRHGRWINHGWSTVCSECGEDYAFAKRNFCPNCGAHMEVDNG